MSTLSISDPAPPITEADLVNLEVSLRIEFPGEVRRFYLQNNGGIPGRGIFRQNGTEYLVNEFLPIKNGPVGLRLEDLYRVLKARGERSFPSYLVPFASDPGGDFFCFSFLTDEYGAIYAYRGDYHDDVREALVPLARGITEFLENLEAE